MSRVKFLVMAIIIIMAVVVVTLPVASQSVNSWQPYIGYADERQQ